MPVESTSLFNAIEKGNLERVRRLLRSGADLEEVDDATEMTPLAVAAEAGHLEIADLLLRVGADPDKGGATTPLATAVLEGHVEVVRLLLEAGADVDRAVDDGFTPLMTAASTDARELVDLLLAAGADPALVNADGESAVEIALAAGHEAVIARLLRDAVPEEDEAPRPPSLFDAIARRDLPTVQEILDRDAAIDLAATDPMGWTALGRAAQQGQPDVVAALLDAGADPDQGGVEAPLAVAAREGFDEVVEILLDEGAVTEPAYGPNPLLAAARGGHGDIVEELLTSEADVEVRDEDDRNALELAALHGRRRAFAALAKHFGESDRDEARAELDAVLAQRLRAVSRVSEFIAKIEAGELREVEKAVRLGTAPLDQFDERGRSLLHVAAVGGHVDLVRLMIDMGAEIDAVDEASPEGRTAFIEAIRQGRAAVARLLADAGADLNRRCSRGWTPLMHAVDADSREDASAPAASHGEGDGAAGNGAPFGHARNGHPRNVAGGGERFRESRPDFAAVTSLLLQRGADVEARDADGNTVWVMTKRNALGAPTSSSRRRKLHQLLRILESAGAARVASHHV